MMADGSNFDRLVPPASFDLVFSHMFLEHIRDPAAVHQNVRSMLKPGGIAIHMFPSPNNLPLILNRLVPEFVSRMLVGAAQPDRDLGGIEGKFPAFYKFCGAPSHRLRAVYESFGFEVVEHVGYIGHDYYLRFPILRDVERRARRSLVRLSVPLTSVVLLVLRKPHAAADV
jgi:SAM-dependent methyltransferase